MKSAAPPAADRATGTDGGDTVESAVRWIANVPAVVWRGCAIAVVTVIAAGSLFANSLEIDGTRYFWLDDDQMISMRYARNFADGHGPVWNPGERVEGYTNFLWMTAMAAVHLLPLADAHTAVVVKVLNWLLACAILLLAERLLRHFVPKPGLALPALLLPLAVCYDVVYWAVHGFETTLLSVVFLWTIVRLLEESARGSARALTYWGMGLLPLVRADGHALWAAAALLALGLARDRSRSLGWLAVAGILPVAHEGFRLAYYGDWFPNTYYLKVVGNPVPQRLAAGARYLVQFGVAYWLALLLSLLGALKAGARARQLLVAALACCCLYTVWVGGDMFSGSRFLAPWVPVVAVLALATAVELGAATPRTQAAWAATLMGAMVIGSFVMPVVARGRPYLTALNGGPAQSLVTAVAIRDNTDPAARVAVHAAGVVPYFSRRYAIDWLGKADRHVARMKPVGRRVGHNKIDPRHSLDELRADMAVMLWLPRGAGTCGPADLARVRRNAAAWVTAMYESDVFQREFCGRAIEPPGGVPIYLRRASAEAKRWRDWQMPRVAGHSG